MNPWDDNFMPQTLEELCAGLEDDEDNEFEEDMLSAEKFNMARTAS